MTQRSRGWLYVSILIAATVIAIAAAAWLTTDHSSTAPRAPRHTQLIPPEVLDFTNKAGFDSATQCQLQQTSCRVALLSLINGERARAGVRNLTLDLNLSRGVGCPGAIGHAKAMAETNTIWHQNVQYPQQSFNQDMSACAGPVLQGQNIGASWGYGKWGGAQANEQGMMAEPHDPQTCANQVNHACTILNGAYTQVGIAFASNAAGGWFIVEDFEAR